MNRNSLLLAGPAIVIAGVAVGFLLAAGPLSGGLEGALYDDTPGPWLYAAATIIGSPAADAGAADALYIVEQRHERLHPIVMVPGVIKPGQQSVTMVPTVSAETVGVDCYVVAPIFCVNPSTNVFKFMGCARSDMLVLAGSVEAAPGAVRTSAPCVLYTVPAAEGVSASTTNDALVGTTIMRRDDACVDCARPSGCQVLPFDAGVEDCTAEASGFIVAEHLLMGDGDDRFDVFRLHPGYRGSDGAWTFWDAKDLYAPADYVRANYHPI